MSIEDVELTMIVVDPELQPRESMDPDRIVQYGEDMLAGVSFPPLRVYRCPDRAGRLYLTSGFHRYHGAEQAGLESIACEVVTGTFAEARWDAAGSNKEFDSTGMPRKRADLKRAIEMAKEAMPDLSQTVIARHVGVTQQYVSKVLTHNGCESTGSTGTDGINRKAPYQPDRREKPDLGLWNFVCPTCREHFDTEVWHCPDCAHHWPIGLVDTCKNCHDVERLEDGTIRPIPEEPDPFSLEVLPSTIATEVRPAARPTFNQTNEMVDWARWTWNPVTGCEHNCVYCYARDIANRFYPEKFAPTYRPERLDAPRNTNLPSIAASATGPVDRTSWRNVFVCSMADLFGRWVPEEWINGVFDSCRKSPEWNYLFLTKFPQRYVGLDFPPTAWVGTSIDEQKRVPNAEKAFRKIESPVKWLSVEPMQEAIEFTDMRMFDWVVIGGRSRSSGAPEFYPEPAWVARLIDRALTAGCSVYCKPNTDPDAHWAGLFRQYPRAFTEAV